MQVSNITFTGADDTTSIAHLEEVSTYFPFVEWGILFPSTGSHRFPSRQWITPLADSSLTLSAHLCGAFVTNAVRGNITTFAGLVGVDLLNKFKRIQLNFHGLPVDMILDKANFRNLIDKLRQEVIVQMDGENDWIHEIHPQTSLLFDTSSGAGRTPFAWPSAIEGRKCGYAGGLGPDNLKAELDYLDYFLPEDTVIWVDMETKLRNSQDDFDIDKVMQCAEIVAPFLHEETYVSAA